MYKIIDDIKNSHKLYIFFWVFPRRQIVVGRSFGTLYQFHLQRLGEQCSRSLWRWNWYRVPKRRPTTIWCRRNTQKKIYNTQITAKVWNQEQSQELQRVQKWCVVWKKQIHDSNIILLWQNFERIRRENPITFTQK